MSRLARDATLLRVREGVMTGLESHVAALERRYADHVGPIKLEAAWADWRARQVAL